MIRGRAFRHFLEVCYCAQAVSASTSHEISHMRTCYSALSSVPMFVPVSTLPESGEDPGNEIAQDVSEFTCSRAPVRVSQVSPNNNGPIKVCFLSIQLTLDKLLI